MAASSTDAAAYNTQLRSDINLFNNYSVVSVSTGGTNFWPDATSSSTSPSSENNWDVDEEEVIKRRIYELKRQFHNGRYLVARHLPRDATEEGSSKDSDLDVQSLLSEYLVHSVQLHAPNGTARVLLAEPEVLEKFSKSQQYNLRGHKVTISPSNTEGLLCVARLPLDFSEEELSNLVASLGEVIFCFLMRSEKTGETKGYGFVEYATKEIALQAKAILDGREMRDTVLICDWLDPSHVTFASLHSSCLYVDRLPKDYRDMGEFRRIFSKVANPPYCQIAMKNGALQDWGLVEYLNPEDAEDSLTSLNGYVLRSQKMRIQYCIPGVRAINIYMKIANDPGPRKKIALLPEPPTNSVFAQLQNLTKHNPAFATSLQNIILTQIQNLQQGGGASNSNETSPPGRSNHKGNRGPQRPGGSLSPSNLAKLNSNARAALVILLAAQMQMQQQQDQGGSPNLLSNPHVLSLLQTLVKQGDPHHSTRNGAHDKHPCRNGFIKDPGKSSKSPLLPTPGGGFRPSWDDTIAPPAEGETLVPLLSGLLNQVPGVSPTKPSQEDFHSTVSTLLSNAHNLQQLLGTLQVGDIVQSPPHLNPTHVQFMAPPPMMPFNPMVVPQGPPLFQGPNPLLSMLLPASGRITSKSGVMADGQGEAFISPGLDQHIHTPVTSGPYMFAPPLSPRMSITSLAPGHMHPATLYQHPQAFLPHSPLQPVMSRIYSPLYLTTANGSIPTTSSSASFSQMQKRKGRPVVSSPEPGIDTVVTQTTSISGHCNEIYLSKKLKKH